MILLDPTTFPALAVPAAGLAVGLLPVTRAQFDYFLGDTTRFPPDALAEMDAISPRASWRRVPADRPEGVLLAGVQPAEAERFAGWLGGGWRLPSAAEWRAVDAVVRRLGSEVAPFREAAADPAVHPAARSILNWSLARDPVSAARAGLWDDGLLEWVTHPGSGHGLYGRTRPGLLSLVLNPQVHDPAKPTTPGRHPGFGVRLVRPLSGGPS